MKTYSWLDQNRFLSHMRTIFCALAITGALVTLPRVEGSPREPASGGFFPCFNFAGPPRQVGENLIVTFNISGTSNGTVTGSVVGTELDVVHRDGSITLHGAALFTGSVKPGTTGTPAAFIRCRLSVFDPIASIDSAEGPTKISPASRQARANSAFSARNP